MPDDAVNYTELDALKACRQYGLRHSTEPKTWAWAVPSPFTLGGKAYKAEDVIFIQSDPGADQGFKLRAMKASDWKAWITKHTPE